jgi:type VI secretion system protein ImpI
MPLKLTITSAHKDLMGGDFVREFRDEGGTIGRSLQNDWILPDPDRFISGKHATIDCRKGTWYLADISTNGIYINDDEEPLGRGNPRRLYDGDRLRMGDFEFAVGIDEGEELDMPQQPLSVVPDELELRVPEATLKTGMQLLDEEEITGDEAFRSTLFGSAPKPVAPPPKSRPETKKPAAAAKPPARPAPRRTPRTDGDLTADQLFDEFLSGLGISRDELHPSIDTRDVMQNAGNVMRELVAGMAELLQSRTDVKTMFRLDQTTVLPHHNNPLKLSRSTGDSIKQLLVGQEGEYLGPQDAVREVCRDLRFHHDAVIEAMSAAVREFAEHFNPVELQETFERTAMRKTWLDALGKLRFWNMYCDLYPELVEAVGGGLPLRFG